MCLLATRDKTWRCCSASQTKAGSPTVRRRYPCRGFARPPLVSSCVPCVPYPPHKLPKSPIQPACRFCASFAAPPMSVAHPIPPAHIPDVLGRKGPAKGAAPACCIQLGGDLRISLRRCQLMDHLDGGRRRFQGAGTWGWPHHHQARDRPAAPVDQYLDLASFTLPIQLYRRHGRAQQLLAFPIGGGRSRPDRGQVLRQITQCDTLLWAYLPVGLLRCLRIGAFELGHPL